MSAALWAPPVSVWEALYARAGGRCEAAGCCNGPPFHCCQLCEGPNYELRNLRLRCRACSLANARF